MDIVNSRFVEIVMELSSNYYGSKKDFYKELGFKAQQLSKIKTGRQDVTTAMIYSLCQKYPEVNTDWIFKGKGDRVEILGIDPTELENIAAKLLAIAQQKLKVISQDS